MTPRVSVVVATRNRRAMLARALASVDAQTFRDYEIVVVDDGSTDGTAARGRALGAVRARRARDRPTNPEPSRNSSKCSPRSREMP